MAKEKHCAIAMVAFCATPTPPISVIHIPEGKRGKIQAEDS